ncbi:MAG: IclR family transcriptional regulator [Desulfobacteraceae bacterium]|nr:IclR family transcriptional regulator [Desulfobacteraceae bacterium]
MKQKLNSVEKALQILSAFDEVNPCWGVRQLSNHLEFSPATVQRLLQALKSYGFVTQNSQTRQYQLGNVYYQFLHTLQSSMPITRAALPYMQQLLAKTQETAHLNAVDGNERVCIDTLESLQHLKASMPIGHRSPLYAGASSKCLLAFSPENFIKNYLDEINIVPVTENTILSKKALYEELGRIRMQGYTQSLGERSQGLGSLSAPVFDHRGSLLAALSLAIPEIRFKNKQYRQLCLKTLLETSDNLSHLMGYQAK